MRQFARKVSSAIHDLEDKVAMSSSSYSRLSQVTFPGIKRLKIDNAPITKGYNWRDEPFSDFECKLGDKIYKLHRIILATGPRSARYFAAVLNEQHPFKEATYRKGDLTELLPPACWPYFEIFLDFLYLSDITFTLENICPLLKIADILDASELQNQAADALDGMIAPFDIRTQDLLCHAIQLKVEPVMEMAAAVVPAKFLEGLIPQLDGLTARVINNSLIYRLMRLEPQENDPWCPESKARQIVIKESFATHGGHVEGMPTHVNNPDELFMWGTVLGRQTATEGVHLWRVRVSGSRRGSADENGFAFGVGLVVQEKLARRDPEDDFLGHMGYSYIALTGQVFSWDTPLNNDEERAVDYASPYENGDAISILLDLNKMTIEFFKNDVPCGIAFTRIFKGTYRLGASLHNPTWGVQLLSHEKLPEKDTGAGRYSKPLISPSTTAASSTDSPASTQKSEHDVFD